MSLLRNAPPLTARSVLASVLLGTDPPWLPTPLLVRTTALFGISQGATRTALSRMVASGEATSDGGGYGLAGRLAARQERQAASRRAETRRWDGTWELATVDGDDARPAADRAALRDALRALRLAELREGVWARPDNLTDGRSPEAMAVATRWCHWWRAAAPTPTPEPSTLWELGPWADGAHELRREMARRVDALEAGDEHHLAEGFVTSAAVLRHLQADPLLPRELLPATWPGDTLRSDYDRYDTAYRAMLRAWFSEG
ncbi:MAG: PaaX family transcriptional regulator C-terminal domain-containing protein [Acidimicrobiales bacterium]